MTASPFLTLHELVKKARQKQNHDNWDYIVGGTETETTVRRNRLALDSIAFRPRVLRDVSHIDPSTRFLGRSLRLPIVLAPVGGLENFTSEASTAGANVTLPNATSVATTYRDGNFRLSSPGAMWRGSKRSLRSR